METKNTNEEIQVLIYGQEDIKKSGGFKKKFIQNWISKTDFFKYLKDLNLKIESNYIDITGNILNNRGVVYKKFRCSYKGFIIGTSGICKEFI